MGMRITWAGQDVTAYVDEKSIDIKNVLGQGAGTNAIQSGRADTAEFVTRLGPLYTAVGAGTHVSSPTLVRMGEVIITDTTSNIVVFGGYASNFEDVSGKTPQMQRVKVSCTDYWQFLDRIMVNEVYDGYTDIQGIRALITKYAPWISLSVLPATPSYTFGPQNFRNKSVQKCIQAIADVVGFQVWITPDKKLHYCSPTQSQPAPFSISNTPNFHTSFPGKVTKGPVFDDTAAIDRVFVFGGKIPSKDFTQDLSPFANGNNTTFMLAYYPRKDSGGKIVVTINGVNLVVGSDTGTSTPANTLKSQGGLADVLVNYDAHTLVFSTAPAAGATVLCTYRYEYPLVVVVPDQTAFQLWGMWLDGSISDETIVDRQQAVQRAKVLLTEQSRGLRSLEITTRWAGIQAGQLLHVDDQMRNIHDNFIVQQVNIKPKPALGGNFDYVLSLGAWNWNVVDVLKASLAAARPADRTTDENAPTTDVNEAYDNLKVSFSFTATTKNFGGYYARATALGDGHDAYPGFFSITT